MRAARLPKWAAKKRELPTCAVGGGGVAFAKIGSRKKEVMADAMTSTAQEPSGGER